MKTHVVATFTFLLTVTFGCSGEDRSVGLFQQLVDPGGCVIEHISTAEHEHYQVKSVSSDGTTLAMAIRFEDGDEDELRTQAIEMNLKTGEQTDLSQDLQNVGPFSPDGRLMVVAQALGTEKTDIFEYERATRELRPVTSHEDWDWLPDYSPDGRYIVFNSYRVDGQSDIFLYEKSNKALRRLTDDPGYDAHAQFSSNGNKIIFHRQRGERDQGGYIFDLIIHDVVTGAESRLTDGDYEESYPAWAPDGRHLVYSSDVDGKPGKLNLYVLTEGGETIGRLTQGDWKDGYAVWSKDGKYIYFNSDRAGTTNVYRLPMDGIECVREPA